MQLTVERLREVLSYDPATGLFVWTKTLSRRAIAGNAAGSFHQGAGAYVYIGIDGKSYRAHRLAWLYVHGELPACGIDHRDGDGTHNWITNLRPAGQLLNMQNLRRPHRDNASGFLGVHRVRGRWVAHISVAGKRTHLGRFDTPAEAHAAYLEGKRRLHPNCTI